MNDSSYNVGMEVQLMETQLIYLQCLYEVICDSDEPETIRRALAAMTSTDAGIEYLRMNPITL